MTPRYPVYVISKGRADCCLTARFLIADGCPFKLVVEPQEVDAYAAKFGRERLLVLPFSNLGLGSIPARNWVWEHAKAAGAERHWILDDNINMVRRLYREKRLRCNGAAALAIVEGFVDRYTNVAIAGLNYSWFVTHVIRKPFTLNCRIYSCLLIRNDLPFRWRGRYNEDTDLSLQVLTAGWCTMLVHAFTIDKVRTMTMKGGNTDELYAGDGRLRMARSLEKQWPGLVVVTRKFGRPQHHIRRDVHFTQQLKRKPGVRIPKDPEHGLVLRQVADEVRSPSLRELLRASK